MLRSKQPSRNHMSMGEAPISDEDFGKTFTIPGLKRYEAKKAVHLEAFGGRLKPPPTCETAEAVKTDEAKGILPRALFFIIWLQEFEREASGPGGLLHRRR